MKWAGRPAASPHWAWPVTVELIAIETEMIGHQAWIWLPKLWAKICPVMMRLIF